MICLITESTEHIQERVFYALINTALFSFDDVIFDNKLHSRWVLGNTNL